MGVAMSARKTMPSESRASSCSVCATRTVGVGRLPDASAPCVGCWSIASMLEALEECLERYADIFEAPLFNASWIWDEAVLEAGGVLGGFWSPVRAAEGFEINRQVRVWESPKDRNGRVHSFMICKSIGAFSATGNLVKRSHPCMFLFARRGQPVQWPQVQAVNSEHNKNRKSQEWRIQSLIGQMAVAPRGEETERGRAESGAPRRKNRDLQTHRSG